ncbi:hypothetical protein [Nocardia sp. NPDC003963]
MPEMAPTAPPDPTLAAAPGRPVEVTDIAEPDAREQMLAAGATLEFADGALAGQGFHPGAAMRW